MCIFCVCFTPPPLFYVIIASVFFRNNNRVAIMRKIKLLLKLILLEFKGKHTNIKGDAYLNDPPIDIVVTWVNGEDEEWLAAKAQYPVYKTREVGPERYRNWDLMRYWFRAVEEYAPWVRKIFFVTEGHIPSWLNTSNEKLEVVKHSDFIPNKYLPTFSSIPIELNFHRIKELSEHFIYLNDDYFLNAPVKKTDFFEYGFPKYYAPAIPIKNWRNIPYYHHLFNNASFINRKFNIRKSIEAHPERWFSKKYKDQMMLNRNAFITNYIPGFYESHIPYNLRKGTLEKVWEVEPELFDYTCTHKFRSSLDVQLYLVKWWEVMNGDYIPYALEEFQDVYFEDMSHQAKEISEALFDSNISIICFNDTSTISDEEYKQGKVIMQDLLEKKYSRKSSYEKD